jgi:hypothetical protein
MENKENLKQAVWHYLDVPWNEIVLFICGIFLLTGEVSQLFKINKIRLQISSIFNCKTLNILVQKKVAFRNKKTSA